MDEPFGPARRYAFLVPHPAAVVFRAADVLTIPYGDESPAGAGRYVPLFRSPARVAQWIVKHSAPGRDIGMAAAPTSDALTSMLVELRKSGVTHVAIDPDPGGRLLPHFHRAGDHRLRVERLARAGHVWVSLDAVFHPW